MHLDITVILLRREGCATPLLTMIPDSVCDRQLSVGRTLQRSIANRLMVLLGMLTLPACALESATRAFPGEQAVPDDAGSAYLDKAALGARFHMVQCSTHESNARNVTCSFISESIRLDSNVIEGLHLSRTIYEEDLRTNGVPPDVRCSCAGLTGTIQFTCPEDPVNAGWVRSIECGSRSD